MSEKVAELFRKTLKIAAAALIMLAVAIDVYAAEDAVMMQQRVTEDSVLLYVRHGGEGQTAEARVGTESAGVSITQDVPVVTWLLVDNSISITKADREKTARLLSDLVAGHAAGEQFNLCTFDEHLNVLVENSQSYPDLKAQIDSLEYVDQETYLTDVLTELLDREDARKGQEYVRVVVISDGVDNNPGGLTRDELNQRLREKNIPIYTLGCQKKGNEQLLKEMYALSRQTNAQSWSLSELEDTLGVTQVMGGAEVPVCAAVSIPEQLRDGAAKGVQLLFSDGAVVETQAVMPFGETVPEPEPAPAPESKPDPVPEPEPEPEPKSSILPYILIGVLAVAAAGGTVVLLILRKKERDRIRPVSEPGPAPSGDDVTMPIDDTDDGSGHTVPLVNPEKRLMLTLIDRKNPDRHFAAPLRSRATIGRGPNNQIVLDYEKTVSSVHCEIFVDGSTFKIRDLHSSNGTFVDNIRVADVAEIANGSVIQLGRLELLVEIR